MCVWVCVACLQGLPVRGPDGKLQGRTLVTVNSGHATVPDGMTIDTDGNLWVALGESGCVVCYRAETGGWAKGWAACTACVACVACMARR